MANQTNSLAQTKWVCKYKGAEIVSVSSFMGYLKGCLDEFNPLSRGATIRIHLDKDILSIENT